MLKSQITTADHLWVTERLAEWIPINRYLAEHNADPKPFVRTATSASIIAKLGRVNVSVS